MLCFPFLGADHLIVSTLFALTRRDFSLHPNDIHRHIIIIALLNLPPGRLSKPHTTPALNRTPSSPQNDAKRSTSCPPSPSSPPSPTAMPPRDTSKARDDYGLALYGPPRTEAEAITYTWAIDPRTAPALTTGAYRMETPGWYVGLDSPMTFFENTPAPTLDEEQAWM
ncbi:uncharacterized protein BT62DRAFT_1009299 [Guyanagaster necrorhizus]|uniref:Uncharacterized protein n=1 Tax=Guyanagaster necrorhizus TaxID=856835 RepID=A0A9P7VMX3_9AGAR|nr:uncharacterized protein BT62DRAFT_1009299 [Guyanagaster necrorhizus MCA 3950]KAG7443485.1 hypothetical protein BT62DRAFT_1009299 [Guyanagaster necrorhizus MCA 3950]